LQYLVRIGDEKDDFRIISMWRPGKAYCMALSPNGKWLALCFGHNLSLYNLERLLNDDPSSMIQVAPQDATMKTFLVRPLASLLNVFNALAYWSIVTFTVDSTEYCLPVAVPDMDTRQR
jgi:hypothetical protein